MFARLLLATVCLALAAPGSARAGDDVGFVVLRENGSGSARSAQPHLDRLLAAAAKAAKFDSASGKYHARRNLAVKDIAARKPAFGILSLGAFLALRAEHKLEVIGKAEVAGAGGRSYHLVSTSAAAVKDCKEAPLVTNHGDDVAFVDKVVAAGAFRLADFKVLEARRPIQALNMLIAGEARCALIDDAQRAALPTLDKGGSVKVVWSSKTLPPMVLVAFPNATAAQKKSLKSSLGRVCTGDAAACKAVGIAKLAPAKAAEYAKVVRAYGG